MDAPSTAPETPHPSRNKYVRAFMLPFLVLLAGLVSGAQQPRMWLYGGGTIAPDESIRLSAYLPPGANARLELLRVRDPEKLLAIGGPRELLEVQALELELLEQRELVGDKRNTYPDVDFGRLPVGLYLARLSPLASSTATGSVTLVLVTDLGLVVKADVDTLLTYTATLDGGEPRATRVTLLHGKRIYAEGLADARGLTEFSVDPDVADELVVAAKYGSSWIFSEAYWNRWAVESVKTYLHTDRSVYRPGHTVLFKGTVRTPSGLQPLVDEQVDVVITAADGSEVMRHSYRTDAHGSFEGELILGAEPPLGSYGIATTVRNETAYASFYVEEYQKPEYQVTVTASSAVTVQGDSARFVIDAQYLFGGPVVGGQVSYAFLKQPYYRWRYRSHFGFYEDVGYGSYYGGEMIDRGEGVLDAEGRLVVDVPLPADEQDYQLTLQAGVTDESRREITGSGGLVAYRSSIVLNVRTESYATKVGEAITVTVEAEDLEGRPASTAFELVAERRYWVQGRGPQSENIRSWQGRTDADGRATLTIALDVQGSYRLRARAADEAGRTTEADRYLWVSGSSRWYWAYDGLSITADKEEYEVGDVARFVIESPVADARLLITREGDSLRDYELVRLDGSVLTYELTVTEADTPNGYLSVTLIGGGEYYLETVGYRVPPADKFLNVEITSDADRYQPRDTGRFSLRVSDASGTGVRAQVALALVDEAIFLVRPDQTPDIRGYFYALKSNLVGTSIGAWYYFGQDELGGLGGEPSEAMTDAVFAQGKGDFAAATVREDFRDTILWLPLLETDDRGLATADVTFPDNLTTWRMTARAITLAGEVGQERYEVITTLPVIARLAAPRFLVRGDEASLRVIGQNNLDSDQQGRLELEAAGLELLGPAQQSVLLPAGGRASADFRVAAETTGSATVTATALTPQASDALRLPFPVLPHGIREEIGWAASGSSSWDFQLPSGIDPASSGGTLYLTPSLSAAVSPALSYLAGYPYGCTEQTMSRFLPSVLAAQAGTLAQLPDEVAATLDDMVLQGLKRLYDFQHDDGGWGFWKYDSSSLFISGYVVSGLLDAQQAGYPVREAVLERGLGYLEEAVRQPPGTGDYRMVIEDGKAYAYYALARAGRPVDGLFQLARLRDMSPYGLALSALSFAVLERTVEADLYLDELIARITENERVAFWDTGAPHYYWNDDNVEATAYGLEALVTLRPDDPIITKVVTWLLLQRQGARWAATKDTAAVVKAALALARQRGEENFDYQVDVTLNGRQLESRRIRGQTTASFQLPLTGLSPGRNALEVAVEGQGTLFTSAAVHYVDDRDELEAVAGQLDVVRRYETLTPVFDEQEQRYLYRRSPFQGTAAGGDYLLVTVEIDPREQDLRYVLVNEPLPAGYRVIENDQAFRIAGVTPRYGWDYYGWNYWYDGRDVRDERVDYYFTVLAEPVTFTYVLRAETPGTYSALPTQVWLMYQPEVRGIGLQATLSVAEDVAVGAH